MSGYLFTKPIIKTKVLTYEALAYETKDTWVRYYRLFDDQMNIKEDLKHYKRCKNVRNPETYDIVIDLTKPIEEQVLPIFKCNGCGKEIPRGTTIIEVNEKYYCSYECYCNTKNKQNLG